MVLGALWLFLIFSLVNFVFTFVNYWQLKNAGGLILFGVKFSSIWTFWFGYCALFIPISFFTTLSILYAYWYGYHEVFPNKVWLVQSMVWFASIFVTFFTTWLYLGELPTKNAIVALVLLLGAVMAILWE